MKGREKGKVVLIFVVVTDQLSNPHLNLGVAVVRFGVDATAAQSLPPAGVAVGKFNRGVDKSSGPGAI